MNLVLKGNVINRSTLYYSPKGVSGQDLEILKLIGKLYFTDRFMAT
jgi:hypothetical protein